MPSSDSATAIESPLGLSLLEQRARAGVWRLSADGKDLWWSEGIYRILGLEPAHRPALDTALALYTEPSRSILAAALAATFCDGSLIDLELELTRADGRLIYVVVLGEPVIECGVITHIAGAFFDIDSRRRESDRLMTQLADSEAELREAQRVARTGSWRWMLEDQTVRWSGGTYDIFGLDPAAPAPDYQAQRAIYTAESFARLDAAVQQALQVRQPYALRLEAIHGSGEPRWVTACGEAILDADGIVIGLRGTVQDVTALHLADEALEQGRRQIAEQLNEIEQLYRNTPVGLFAFDRDLRFLRINEQMAAINGLPAEAHLGRRFGDVVPALGEHISTLMQPVLQTGQPLLNVEVCGRTPLAPDQDRDWLVNYHPIVNTAGEIVGVQGAVLEVTAQKRLVRASREREQRFSAIFNSMFQFIGLLSPEGVLLEVNDAAVAFAGVARSALVGKPFWEGHWFRHSPAAAAALQAAIRRAAAGEFVRYEVELLDHGADLTIVDLSLNPVFDDEGRVTAIIPEGRDVTETRRNREQLLQSEAQFRSALENAPIGMALVSLEGRFTRVNTALCQIVGYTEAELMQLTFQQITVPDDLDLDLENLQRLIEGAVPRYKMEKRYVRKDRSEVWIQLTASALRDANGRLVHFIAQIEDIHERKQNEAQLEQLRQRHALALKSGDVGVWECTPATHTLIWDAQMYELYGLDALNLVSFEDWTAALHRDDHDLAIAAVSRCMAEKTEVNYRFRIHHPRLGVRHIEASADVILDGSGAVQRVVGVNRDVTEAHLAQEQLRQSEERFRLMVDAAIDYAIVLLDARGHVTSWNHGAARMYGYQAEDITGRSLACLHPPEDQYSGLPMIDLRRAESIGSAESEGWRIRHDGRRIWVNSVLTVMRDANQRLLGYAMMSRDLTERRAAEQQVAEANHLRQVILEASPFAIITCSVDGLIQSFNAAAERMLGYRREEMVRRQTPALIHDAAEVVQRAAELSEELQRPIEPGFEVFICKAALGQVEEREWSYLRKDGSRLQVNLTVTALRDQTNRICGYLGAAYDITDRKRREALTQHIAQHDHLTGLPNRVLLNDRLGQAIRRAGREGSAFAVLMLDLDHFKRVNDSLGHHVGDELLKVVAERLVASVRESDTVARMGGDEFVVLLPSISDVSGVARVAEAIVRNISQTIVIGSHELDVTPSVGVAMFPQDGHNANGLLKNADAAMYKAKGAGRACFEIFSSELETKAISDLQIENELRVALRRGELQLHYQPQVCLTTGQMIGVEALVRWHHPTKGMISPAAFIPIAESTGLILPISEWIIKTACRECLEIQKKTGTSLMLAINLSPRQLEKGRLCGLLRETLQQTGFTPENLELEITEGVLMAHIEDAKTILTEIQALGVKIAIDDFGTGFSSLSYLTQLPINTLKIDRGFVQKVTHNVRDAAVVNAILALAQSLDLRVIAEGVETLAQLKYLLQRQCSAAQGTLLGPTQPAERFCVQGYLVSKALPAAELASRFHFLESGSRCSVASAGQDQGVVTAGR